MDKTASKKSRGFSIALFFAVLNHALERAYLISTTQKEEIRKFAEKVSMPLNGLIPFLRTKGYIRYCDECSVNALKRAYAISTDR